jgi:hypothetical protein
MPDTREARREHLNYLGQGFKDVTIDSAEQLRACLWSDLSSNIGNLGFSARTRLDFRSPDFSSVR